MIVLFNARPTVLINSLISVPLKLAEYWLATDDVVGRAKRLAINITAAHLRGEKRRLVPDMLLFPWRFID